LDTNLDPRTERHLSGGCGQGLGWLSCWVCTYVFIIGCSVVTSGRPFVIGVTWLCTVASTLIVPAVAYLCLGRPDDISLGLLVNFFWWGGVGGVIIAGIGEGVMMSIWKTLSPQCNIAVDSVNDSVACAFLRGFEFVLTPGLWEELFKGIWILLRFKSDLRWTNDRGVDAQLSNSVPRTTCCCLPTDAFTFWWRIARSPAAIFMSALAAGGGFEAIENILYMVIPMSDPSHSEIHMTLGTVIFRACLFTHILWTGYVGVRLAQRQFGPKDSRPTLVLTFVPPMVLHGLWDWWAFSASSMGVLGLGLGSIFCISILLVLLPIRQGALSSDA